MQRHKFDSLSFAFGAIYTMVGLLFLIPATVFDLGPVMTASLRWAWPFVVVGIGAAVVIPVLVSHGDADHSPVDEEDTKSSSESDSHQPVSTDAVAGDEFSL